MAIRRRKLANHREYASNENAHRTESANDALSFATQKIVTVIVGEGGEQTPFQIHANLLSSSSILFSEKIDADTFQAELKPLVLSDVSVETFKVFVDWIYGEKKLHKES